MSNLSTDIVGPVSFYGQLPPTHELLQDMLMPHQENNIHDSTKRIRRTELGHTVNVVLDYLKTNLEIGSFQIGISVIQDMCTPSLPQPI
jgi:hypothetical protein